MKFDELDKQMRTFETAHDHCVLPDMCMVARLDGRNFTRLTRDTCEFEAPFDEVFRDLMVDTTMHLMQCGFKVIYGYTQSDEISLLLHPEDTTFNRKLRKINSVLAGEASAMFSTLATLERKTKTGEPVIAAFDCRVSQLPNADRVCDYFSWRQEDANRNALNSYCYWTLRQNGATVGQATKQLSGMGVATKNELLFQLGINYNDVPSWQKRGVGIKWWKFNHIGFNPITQEQVATVRNMLEPVFDLPARQEYVTYIQQICEQYRKAN